MLDLNFLYMTAAIFAGGLLVKIKAPEASTKYVLGCFILGFLYGAINALI